MLDHDLILILFLMYRKLFSVSSDTPPPGHPVRLSLSPGIMQNISARNIFADLLGSRRNDGNAHGIHLIVHHFNAELCKWNAT
jgi:hypothetical protein